MDGCDFRRRRFCAGSDNIRHSACPKSSTRLDNLQRTVHTQYRVELACLRLPEQDGHGLVLRQGDTHEIRPRKLEVQHSDLRGDTLRGYCDSADVPRVFHVIHSDTGQFNLHTCDGVDPCVNKRSSLSTQAQEATLLLDGDKFHRRRAGHLATWYNRNHRFWLRWLQLDRKSRGRPVRNGSPDLSSCDTCCWNCNLYCIILLQQKGSWR